MFQRILFLGRKKDIYSKLIFLYIKNLAKNIKVFYSEKPREKINKKIFNVPKLWYDYIISFRSFHILNENQIQKSRYGAINFHPGPPEYRGIGCVNYALYDGVRRYGVTAHLISKKIDHGKIINVKRLKILKKDNVESLLKKTYLIQYKQAKKIIKLLSRNKKNLNILIYKSRKEKWINKIKKRKDLNRFYEIKKNITKEELKRKVRATFTKKYKPYFFINNKKIIIKNLNSIKKYNIYI